MNRVRNVVLAVALAAQGCGGEDAGTEGSLEANSALLFEDRYSDTGAIRIYDHGEHLSVQVFGGLGIDDHLAMGQLLASGDLSHVYLTLHPEALSAPEELKTLDARWELERAAAAEMPEVQDALEQRAKASESLPLIDKNRSSFLSNACQTFGPWFDAWIPDLCRFAEATTGLVQVNCTNSGCNNQWLHHAEDRAFIWNEGVRAAQVGFFDINAHGTVDFYRHGAIAAQTWSYFSNSFDTVNYGVQVDSGTANFGVTHHFRKVTPR